jgi:hypothetical protein
MKKIFALLTVILFSQTAFAKILYSCNSYNGDNLVISKTDSGIYVEYLVMDEHESSYLAISFKEDKTKLTANLPIGGSISLEKSTLGAIFYASEQAEPMTFSCEIGPKLVIK